jgi:hypothetical protein
MPQDQVKHQKSSPAKLKSKVDFLAYANVVDIPNISSLSLEEINSMWITNDDFLRMREDRKATMQLMSRGVEISCDDDEDCALGIQTQDDAIRRKSRVYDALFAVFTEQQYQWEDESQDPDLIADSYFEVSCEDQSEASERAIQLAKQVAEEFHRVPFKLPASCWKRTRKHTSFLSSATSKHDGSVSRIIEDALDAVYLG